jgi:hypothetical protein
MNLDDTVDQLSRLCDLKLYQEYGFTHLNEAMGHPYLAVEFSSICHLDP